MTLPSLPQNDTPATLVGDVARVTTIIAEMTREGLTAAEIAARHNIDFSEVVRLLSDPAFVRHFSGVRRELAKVEFDSIGHSRMVKVMQGGDDKSAVMAYKVQADVLGVTEKKVKVSHEHKWVDETIAALEKDGVIIDAEHEEVK